jgi:hypothetical protein
MDKIYFTAEQINQLRNALMELPYKHSVGFLQFIEQVIENQKEEKPAFERA